MRRRRQNRTPHTHTHTQNSTAQHSKRSAGWRPGWLLPLPAAANVRSPAQRIEGHTAARPQPGQTKAARPDQTGPDSLFQRFMQANPHTCTGALQHECQPASQPTDRDGGPLICHLPRGKEDPRTAVSATDRGSGPCVAAQRSARARAGDPSFLWTGISHAGFAACPLYLSVSVSVHLFFAACSVFSAACRFVRVFFFAGKTNIIDRTHTPPAGGSSHAPPRQPTAQRRRHTALAILPV